MRHKFERDEYSFDLKRQSQTLNHDGVVFPLKYLHVKNRLLRPELSPQGSSCLCEESTSPICPSSLTLLSLQLFILSPYMLDLAHTCFLQPFTIFNFWVYNLCWQPMDGNCCDHNVPTYNLGNRL